MGKITDKINNLTSKEVEVALEIFTYPNLVDLVRMFTHNNVISFENMLMLLVNRQQEIQDQEKKP